VDCGRISSGIAEVCRLIWNQKPFKTRGFANGSADILRPVQQSSKARADRCEEPPSICNIELIPFVDAGTYLYRFMDHRTDHFWPSIADMLSEQKLFLNSRTKFNDPYDSEPIIETDLSNSTIRDYLNEMFENPDNHKRSPSQVSRIISAKASGRSSLKKGGIQNVKESLRANTKEFLDSCGLLSFSLTAENPLLWGHYAA
jgi:hypothetical protein